jgi:hypothetical protein
MVHLTFNIITAFFFLAITRDRDAFFNYPAKIEVFSVVFPAFRLTLTRAVNRFSAVLSVSVKFFY